MYSVQRFLKRFLVLLIAVSYVQSGMTYAVTLNFSATLTPGTCSLNLDKSTLSLGSIQLPELQPGKLLSAQPFTLFVQDCTGLSSGVMKPVLQITGPGVRQDGKWLFRNADSAKGVGIVVIQSNTLPEYSHPEIGDGTTLTLGSAGQIPVSQSFTFYAGVSCGGSDGCTAVKTGGVSANLYFTFKYQ